MDEFWRGINFMWKDTDYDHTLIQATVIGIDEFDMGDSGTDPRLLAFSTSYVMENYVRPNEYAVFGSELKRENDVGYEIQEVTQVLVKGSPDPTAVFLRSETFYLGLDFKPLVDGLVMNEVSRYTVREFIMRNNIGVRPVSKK